MKLTGRNHDLALGTRIIKTLRLLRRAVLLRWYRWHLDCLLHERMVYLDAEIQLGQQYLRNSLHMERVLKGRIAFLDCLE